MITEPRRFWNFVAARERLRERKDLDGTRPPWSRDPTLNRFHFCNVNREDDYVTRWIAKVVRPVIGPSSRYDLSYSILQLLVCRIFNEPEFLRRALPYVTQKDLVLAIRKQRAEGGRVMRGAYLMVPHEKKGTIERYFPRAIANAALKIHFAHLDWENTHTLEEIAKVLCSCHGIGPFIANQVCTDLRYLSNAWLDWESFVLAGPGTRRGLNRYFGVKNVRQGCSQPKMKAQLLFIRDKAPRKWKHLFQDINNLANCFCEFDKYRRAQHQQAAGKTVKLKRLYKPNPIWKS